MSSAGLAALRGLESDPCTRRSLPKAHTGRARSRALPGLLCLEVCGLGGACKLCAAGTTVGALASSVPCLAGGVSVVPRGSFLSVIVFLVQRGQRNVLGQRTGIILLHICDRLACVSTLLCGVKFPDLAVNRLAQGMVATRGLGADGAPRAMRRRQSWLPWVLGEAEAGLLKVWSVSCAA